MSKLNKPLELLSVEELERMALFDDDVQAQWHLGNMFNFGQGVEKDSAKARRWYEMAADNEHVEANYLLALEHSRFIQDEDHSRKACMRFYRAAVQGHKEAKEELCALANKGVKRAPYYLALMYHNGKGNVRNATEAQKWFRIAKDQRDPWAGIFIVDNY